MRERLSKAERILLGLGLAGAVFFALLVCVLMVVVGRPAAPLDPDAQTPIIPPDFPRRLVDFSLIDQSGRPFTRQELQGKIVVASFVFTSCAAVCPYVNAQMEKIQQLTNDQYDVRLVSLTMDPVDDTAPVLAKYGENFGEDPSRWSFLTGEQSEVYRLVGASFLPPDTTGEFGYMPGNFAHTQRIALVDKQGRLVEYFDGLNQEAGDAVVREIAKLRTTQP